METIMTKRFILDEANPRTYNRQGLNQNNAAGNVKYNKDKQTTEAMPDAKPSGENKLSVGELFSLAKTVSDQLTQIIDYNKHGEDTIKNLNDAYKSVTDGVKQGLEAEDGRKGTAAFNSAVIDFIKQTKQIILSLRYTDNDDKSAGDNLIKILNELQDNVTPIDHVHSEKDVSKIKTSIQSLYNGMTAVVKSQLNKTQDASAIEQAIKYLNGGSMFFSKSFYTTEHLTELAEPIALVSNAVGQIDKVINKPISDGGLGGGINDIYIDLPNYTNLTNVCQDFNDVIASNETTAVTTSQSTAETEVD